MAKPPPYPPKAKGSASKAIYAGRNLLPKMMGPAKSMKVDPLDYLGKPSPKRAVGPAKPKTKPKGSGSAGIGEIVPKPSKKKVRSGSTSARIRNMEKKYSRRLMEK
jgi:hypothetical protein